MGLFESLGYWFSLGPMGDTQRTPPPTLHRRSQESWSVPEEVNTKEHLAAKNPGHPHGQCQWYLPPVTDYILNKTPSEDAM